MRVVNRSELAEVLGVSLVTVDNWTAAGCPFRRKPVRKGVGQWEFEVGAVVEWRLERERKSALGELANVTEIEARRRKLAAEAAMAEHELAVAQGKVASIADVARTIGRMISAVRAKLLALGSKLGPQVQIEDDLETCKAIIDGAVAELLVELSKYDPGPVDEEPAEESVDAIDSRLAEASTTIQRIRNAVASGGKKDLVVKLCDTAISTIFQVRVPDEPGGDERAAGGRRSGRQPLDSSSKADGKRVGGRVPAVKPRRK
jgi:phage terminase Nu1 subunit (DNA packaging protein)